MAFSPADQRLMERALALAERGRGRVEPNPMVGCVLVCGGRVIGEGYHQRFGGPHAEVVALRACRGSAAGATCYVSLEPCCHFGKTPPCADALIRAGVARVVAAVRDPFPKVAGGGFRKLRAAGIRVDVGLLRDAAAELNAPFFKLQAQRQPWVILKWAQSLDGKIATRSGDSKWITSLAARRAAHQLRAVVDAVIVGVGTVVADDPDLTCRLVRPRRIATRIVLDTSARTPIGSRLVRTARETPTMIAVADADSPRAKRLAKAGCEILELPTRRGRLRLDALLDALGRRGMTNVMVEGGGRVLGEFVDRQLADEAALFVAPRLIGGTQAIGALAGVGPIDMEHLPPVRLLSQQPCGDDIAYRLRFDWTASTTQKRLQ